MKFCVICVMLWITVVHCQDMVCPRNEVFSNSHCLAIASCQPTCPTSQVHACPMICLHGGCVCEPGYLRDPKRNYTCVAEEQCLKPDMIDRHCPHDEIYSHNNCLAVKSCQPGCPTSQAHPCPRICLNGGCVCKAGYLRDSKRNYTCVAEERCSKPDEHHCPRDEMYSDNNCLAAKSCQPTCPKSQVRPCPKICLLGGCVCKPGYLRDSKQNYTCVAEERCSKPDMIDHHCPRDEIYSDNNCLAAKSCQPTCPKSQVRPCPKICLNGGCVCKPGYLRDSKQNYTCVAEERCSKRGAEKVSCGKGEVWTEGCVTPCPETCHPYVRRPCPFMCKLRGCICKTGYVRDQYKNNTCVPKDKCPKQTSTAAAMQKCAKDEQPSDCALLPIICQALCPNVPPTGVMCSQVCHKGCVCKAGYVRDPRKGYKCVEEDKC